MTTPPGFPIRDHRGAALLLALLLALFVVIAIAGAMMRTSAERRIAMDAAAQVDAVRLAEGGIDAYVTATTTLPATLPDSQAFPLQGGRAMVTLRALRQAPGDTLMALVSRGENSVGDRYAANAGMASRTVVQLVRWTGGTPSFPAGFVALNGMDKNGNSGTLSGVDGCTTPPAPLPSIGGVAVPSMTASDPTPNYTGHTGPIDGNPDNTPLVLGTPGPSGTAKDAVHIDWAGIKARTALSPTYYYKTSAPTSGHWPTSSQISGSNWPIVFVEGNLSLPSDGQGLLIVTGNLTTAGNDLWKGVVLVGGTMTVSGTPDFLGTIITGLNVKTGSVVAQTSVGNGNVTFQYNSCYVTKVLSPFGGWSRLGNARLDNYPAY